MLIATVIPLYDNPDTILDVALACRKKLAKVVVVDDASTKLPPDFEKTLADNDIQLLRHVCNQGYGAAIMTGIAELSRQGFDYAITLRSMTQARGSFISSFLAYRYGRTMTV